MLRALNQKHWVIFPRHWDIKLLHGGIIQLQSVKTPWPMKLILLPLERMLQQRMMRVTQLAGGPLPKVFAALLLEAQDWTLQE